MTEELQCPVCGRAVAEDDRFCSGCGSRLGATGGGPPGARASLQDVFAHLRSGEQRPATVLMTDVSGFSALGEKVEPEWLFHLINQVFDELAECLLAHGAHIDKYVGDEIVALFGVPIAQEDPVERAIMAALAVRDRLVLLNQQGRFGEVALNLHTGINMGRVMVGPVGHRSHADYTVIGDTVNVAKRLEEEAPAGEIFVSRAARDAAGELFDFERVGVLPLRGRQEPVEAFRVTGARRAIAPRAVRIEAAAHVPREAELDRLVELADLAQAGKQQVACIVGPAGIGKSSLVADFSRDAAVHELRVAATVCHTCGQHFPFLPLADLVAQFAGLHIEGWPPAIRGDVRKLYSELPLAQSDAQNLRTLVEHINEPPQETQPDLVGAFTDSFVALVRALAQQQPVCLIVEDVQWIDEGSQSVLTEALSWYSNWPVYVILSARPPVPEWAKEDLQLDFVELKPFPRKTMEALVSKWAGPRTLPRSTIRAICDRAQGHPYFARELVRTLRDRSLHDIGDDAGLPRTLQQLFLKQLDELPYALRRVVQAASVVGEPFSHSLLEAAMGREVPLTEALLWNATQHNLLRASGAPGQFVFGPRLLFDTAYATIPTSQRQALHARIADHITDQMDRMGGVAIHSAAHHAYLGYRDERAIDLLLRSARQYRVQYANRQAIEAATRAIEIISSLPDPMRYLKHRLEALLLLGQSYQVVGDIGHAEGSLSEAEVLAEDCEDDELVAKIALSAATLRWMQGEAARAEQDFARAREAWQHLGDATRAAHALVGMGLCAGNQGQRKRAAQLFLEAANTRGIEPWVRAAALNNVGMLWLEEGNYARAEPHLTQGLAANEKDGDRRGVAQSRCSLGELYYRTCAFEKAADVLERAREDAAEMEDVECLQLATTYLVRALIAIGSTEQATELIADLPAPPEAEQAEARAMYRVAELESAAPCAIDPHRSAPPSQGAAPDAPEEVAEHPVFRSAVHRNAYLERLCVGIEAALLSGQKQRAHPWIAALRENIDGAVDTNLTRYGRWLLQIVETDREPPPPTEDIGEEPNVFHLRAQRLTRALRSGDQGAKDETPP